MRSPASITVAVVVLTVLAVPGAAQDTTTECGTTTAMDDGSMEGMANGTTTAGTDGTSMETERMNGSADGGMDNGSMATTTDGMGDGDSIADVPGFGVVAAVLALAAAVHVARRRP